MYRRLHPISVRLSRGPRKQSFLHQFRSNRGHFKTLPIDSSVYSSWKCDILDRRFRKRIHTKQRLTTIDSVATISEQRDANQDEGHNKRPLVARRLTTDGGIAKVGVAETIQRREVVWVGPSTTSDR
jgi:hypothetical protein